MQYTTRVFKFPNATVRVHSPILTPEEKEKRMEKFKLAAANLLKEAIKNESKIKNK